MNINIRGIRLDKLLKTKLLSVLPLLVSRWDQKHGDQIDWCLMLIDMAEFVLVGSVAGMFTLALFVSHIMYDEVCLSTSVFSRYLAVITAVFGFSNLVHFLAAYYVARFTKSVNRLDYLLQECGLANGITGFPGVDDHSLDAQVNALLRRSVLQIRRCEIEDKDEQADIVRKNSRALAKLLREEFDIPTVPFSLLFQEAERQIADAKAATERVERVEKASAKISEGTT